MTIVGKIFDAIMIAFYVAFCLFGVWGATMVAVEGDYWVAVIISILTTLFAVKLCPWNIGATLPRWLAEAPEAFWCATDRTADAIEHMVRSMGGAIWLGLKVIFYLGVIPALVIVTFLAWPVVCLLAVIIVILFSMFKFMIEQAEKAERP